MNMAYCRFQNTVTDLHDCAESITEVISKEEHYARARLVKLCQQIIDESDDIPEKHEYQDEGNENND